MVRVSFCTDGVTPTHVRACSADGDNLIVHAPFRLAEGTRVILRKGKRSSEGVVSKCAAERKKFLLTVRVLKGASWLLDIPPEHDFDPGASSVDNFLSVEQLSILLAESGGNTHNAR